jgi:CubicO group peptidase (beta-lactamase class C family)
LAAFLVLSTRALAQCGPHAQFPTIELVHYKEDIGQVQNTQILFATATVTLRAVNTSAQTSTPAQVSITDFNGLMRQNGKNATFGALKAGQSSGSVVISMTAALPAPTSQLGQEQQIAQWKASYQQQCGVDLRAVVDFSGPPAQAPVNDHQEQYLYEGYGSSKPWDENRPLNTTVCTDKECVSLNDVARSIHKQIGCKVVGYAFFVGDQIDTRRGVFGAFGKARTSLNPPETDFAPTTEMQIASASKVLTALAGVRVFGAKLEDAAFKYFPSNWTPANTVVKNITLRQFLSQTSGVKQYYTTAGGDDFAALQAFFSQNLPNASSVAPCTGSGAKRPIPNPIATDKSPCYSNTNFGIMRLILPHFGGLNSNDPTQLAQRYVQQVQQNVFTPVGAASAACKPTPNPNGYALLYKYPGNSIFADWGDLTTVCGSWGWYVSVNDYARVLVSLNSGDHKILTDCQFDDMQNNPSNHPLGWDTKSDSPGHRWLEKNGADSSGNNALQTTSVAIYGGSMGCKANGGSNPVPGIAGALFINSDVLVPAKQNAPRGRHRPPQRLQGSRATQDLKPFVFGLMTLAAVGIC